MFLREYEEKLNEVAKAEGLICLGDFDRLKFDGKNSLEFSDLISNTRLIINTDGNIDLLVHDLIYSISPDIKFSLANVFLFIPGSNNFSKEIVKRGEQIVPTYFITQKEKRFFYYINTTFEKLYTFWDRIGDTLAMAFDLKIPERKIFFATVIEELYKLGIESGDLLWLRNFKNSDYNNFLNRLRIKIVHYRQKDSYFFMEWTKTFLGENHEIPELLVKLQKEKESLPGLLKEQLALTNIGFEKCIRLINECGPFQNSVNNLQKIKI